MIALMLSIIFLIFSYNGTMPRVSYIKAMDVYLGVCFLVVFLALVKLTVIKYMRQKLRATSDSSGGNRLLHIQETSIVNHNMNEYTSVPIEPILENQVNLFPEDMIFFFAFLIFCLFFFIVYPNVHFQPADPDCLKENAEWFAEIP
uniref:Neurotransmitter-gated ion-channel transmembrane domain-containing protein n=1 Tax=Acrobeloides nanus TaxID=290746 RepID=A0A914ELQ4_9BILA